MSSSDDKLAAKVVAVNTANRHAKQLYAALRDVFASLVGEQVCKKDGGLLAKVTRLLPVGLFPNTRELVVYRHSSGYHLAWVVRACVLQAGSSQSHETMVYVGTLLDGVLVELVEPFTGRSDWTPQEVVAKREAYWAAKKAAEMFKEAFYPFSEFES
jgi:hypothetical protein